MVSEDKIGKGGGVPNAHRDVGCFVADNGALPNTVL